MRVVDLYHSAIDRLRRADIDDAELDASFLLGHLLKLSRAQLFLDRQRCLAPSLVTAFESLLERRLRREPLAYILGEQEFWSLPFTVSPDVLIPRPETELLLERALAALRDSGHGEQVRILDLGSGSGVIPVVLALELPGAMVYSLDRSFAAITVATANARRHRVADRVFFVNSDWFAGLRPSPVFDLVITNPPYVARGIADTLQPEVRCHEPELALFGGERGTDAIDRICAGLGQVLKKGGWFFMEIGADQREYALSRLRGTGGFDNLAVHEDYAGLARIVQARRCDT